MVAVCPHTPPFPPPRQDNYLNQMPGADRAKMATAMDYLSKERIENIFEKLTSGTCVWERVKGPAMMLTCRVNTMCPFQNFSCTSPATTPLSSLKL